MLTTDITKENVKIAATLKVNNVTKYEYTQNQQGEEGF